MSKLHSVLPIHARSTSQPTVDLQSSAPSHSQEAARLQLAGSGTSALESSGLLPSIAAFAIAESQVPQVQDLERQSLSSKHWSPTQPPSTAPSAIKVARRRGWMQVTCLLRRSNEIVTGLFVESRRWLRSTQVIKPRRRPRVKSLHDGPWHPEPMPKQVGRDVPPQVLRAGRGTDMQDLMPLLRQMILPMVAGMAETKRSMQNLVVGLGLASM